MIQPANATADDYQLHTYDLDGTRITPTVDTGSPAVAQYQHDGLDPSLSASAGAQTTYQSNRNANSAQDSVGGVKTYYTYGTTAN